jgi:hypothetical protein
VARALAGSALLWHVVASLHLTPALLVARLQLRPHTRAGRRAPVCARIRARAFELLAMRVLEALFGLGGVIDAPVTCAQAKALLPRHGWV